MFGPERHENLTAALPVGPKSAVVDLGCGNGETLRAVAAQPDGPSRLVGVDVKGERFIGKRVEYVIADLKARLPFGDESFDAAVCQNGIECLAEPDVLITEAARSLMPGGYLLLGHSDFDTLVFSATDLALTRRLVRHLCDTVQPFMTVADGTISRRLTTLGRGSPMELMKTCARVEHHTTFAPDGPAYDAAMLVAADEWRDPALREHVDEWLADLDGQARRKELLYSLNDYAVLLRKPAASLPSDG
jgi:SAM-dependent methyltransferase